MELHPLSEVANDDADARTPIPQVTLSSSQASVHSSAADKMLGGSHLSDQTSSDKLSALPTGLPTSTDPSSSRPRRSPVLPSQALPSHLYRRSLVETHSLPSFSTSELESQRNAHTWKGPYQTTKASSHASTSADTSQVDAKPRVSFESDPGHISSRPQIAKIPITSISDPSLPPSPTKGTPGSRSPSLARATSPLRIFQQLSANLTRHRHAQDHDEPFIPIDPFKLKRKLKKSLLSSPATNFLHLHEHHGSQDSMYCTQCQCIPSSSVVTASQNVRWFFTDTLPRQIYLNFLLRLPSMYFTRVAKLFEDAEVSKPDIQRMIECGGGGRGPAAQYWAGRQNPSAAGGYGIPDPTGPPHTGFPSPPRAFSSTPNAAAGSTPGTNQQPPLPFPDEWSPPVVPHSLIRFKSNWEAFIDSLLREWKTLNLVSALLLTAILTMFQIPEASHDPITRTAAFISLICALMSLTYGCIYIVRFGTMRSMYRACKWAEQARRTDTLIWWNVWVLLAMPAIWLAWSMVAFIVSILSYVWRTGSSDDPDPDANNPVSPRAALGPRIAITCILALGLIYFALIVKTLRSYGAHIRDQPRTLVGPAGSGSPNHTPRNRARELSPSPGVEQRGRDRGRRSRGPTPENGSGPAVEVVNVDAGVDNGKDAGKLKPNMLGLGLARFGSREPEGEEFDLEKGLKERVQEKSFL